LKFVRCCFMAKVPRLTLNWIDFRSLAKEGCSTSFRRCQFGNLFRLFHKHLKYGFVSMWWLWKPDFVPIGVKNPFFFHAGSVLLFPLQGRLLWNFLCRFKGAILVTNCVLEYSTVVS
jgi:hypothetical protein